MKKTFNHTISEENIQSFEKILSEGKPALIENIEGLSGYLSVIVYLYHLDGTAAEKINWLAGLIVGADLPIFLLHFYFAGLVFLSKESPDLFDSEDLKKINSDIKISSTISNQRKKMLNLSNDLALLNTAIFQGGISNEILVYPYIATRDRLCKLFVSQITCEGVVNAGHGRVNGVWKLLKGGLLEENLGQTIVDNIPRRTGTPSRADLLVRKANLRAFTDLYMEKTFSMNCP